MGTLYQRGNVWWVKYHRGGKAYYESSKSTVKDDAKHILRLREGDIARGVAVTSRANRVTVDELLGDVVLDYSVNRKRTLAKQERLLRLHLVPFFGGMRAASVTTADVQRYVAER